MNFTKYKQKNLGLLEMISVDEFVKSNGDLRDVKLSSNEHHLYSSDPEEFYLGYVARNSKDYKDLWYVSKEDFDAYFEIIT